MQISHLLHGILGKGLSIMNAEIDTLKALLADEKLYHAETRSECDEHKPPCELCAI